MNTLNKRNQGKGFRKAGQEGFSEKATCEQRAEGHEEMSHADIWGKRELLPYFEN